MDHEIFPTNWGFNLRFPLETPLGNLEAITRFLIGEGRTDPEVFGAHVHQQLEERRYFYSDEDWNLFVEATMQSVFSAERSMLEAILPDKPVVLEVGVGKGKFTQNTTIPVAAQKGGTVISTEIGTNESVFKSIVDPESRERLVSGVDVRNLAFKDSSFDSVVANSVLDVLPHQHIIDGAVEMARVLKPGGTVVHLLDLGPGVGWARGSSSETQGLYSEALKERGIFLNGTFDPKFSKKLSEQLPKGNMFEAIRESLPDYKSVSKNSKEIAAALKVTQHLFHTFWLDCVNDLKRSGIPKERIPFIDLNREMFDMFTDPNSANFIANIYSLASEFNFTKGKNTYEIKMAFMTITLLDLMQRSLLKNLSEEDNDLFEKGISRGEHINKDIFERSEPDFVMIEAIQIMFLRLGHICSEVMIIDGLKKAGLEIEDVGVSFGDAVEISGADAGYVSLAGAKFALPVMKSSVRSLVHHIVARKPVS